jgi:hypothetical protein
MVTLFDERDLVSFGAYMISDTRRKSIEENPDIKSKEEMDKVLKMVTQFDFNNWLTLKLRSEQEEKDTTLDNEISDEDIIDEEDHPKIVKLNPNNN